MVTRKITFDSFTTTDLKKRIIRKGGKGGFKGEIKIKALKELMKRQSKRS